TILAAALRRSAGRRRLAIDQGAPRRRRVVPRVRTALSRNRSRGRPCRSARAHRRLDSALRLGLVPGRERAHRTARAGERGHPRAGVGFRDGRDQDDGSDLAILPVPDGARVGYRLAHRVRLSVAYPPGEWTTYVDAQDGRVWARENSVRWVASSDGGVNGAIL